MLPGRDARRDAESWIAMSGSGETVPKPKEIDALILKFSRLEAKLARVVVLKKLREERVAVVKAELVAMVQAYGAKHAEKSKRLVGLRNTATITTGTLVAVDDKAVDAFKSYLDGAELPGLRERFFTEQTTYQLVAAPAEVLKTLDLKGKIRTKLTALVSACFQIKTKAPSLKVDVVEAQAA